MAFTRIGGSWVHEYVCKSTDTKYTRATHPNINIPNGSTCLEMDTVKIFIYDKNSDAWLPITLE